MHVQTHLCACVCPPTCELGALVPVSPGPGGDRAPFVADDRLRALCSLGRAASGQWRTRNPGDYCSVDNPQIGNSPTAFPVALAETKKQQSSETKSIDGNAGWILSCMAIVLFLDAVVYTVLENTMSWRACRSGAERARAVFLFFFFG